MPSTDPWAEVPEFPVSDWKDEVANDETRLGYRAWVEHQREAQVDEIELTDYARAITDGEEVPE